jgi:hypothetical protein
MIDALGPVSLTYTRVRGNSIYDDRSGGADFAKISDRDRSDGFFLRKPEQKAHVVPPAGRFSIDTREGTRETRMDANE